MSLIIEYIYLFFQSAFVVGAYEKEGNVELTTAATKINDHSSGKLVSSILL